MPPVLETERAFLRELLLNDVEPLIALLGQVARPEAYDLPAATALRPWVLRQHEVYREGDAGLFAVIDRDSAVLVGLAGITARDFGEEGARELFCWIDASARGRGLGREVAAALHERALGDPAISRVAMLVPESDAPARRLAESLGSRTETRSKSVAGDSFLLVVTRRSES